MVSHPPHLLDATNTLSPSAFIPFCAFKSQLGITKTFNNATLLPNSLFPMCNSFTPVALGGQLCYNLKLNMTGRQGKDGGLILVLDLNEDRSISLDLSDHPEVNDPSLLLQDEKNHEEAKKDAKIHIHLLAPLKGFGGGHYKMTSVKKVKGTKAFLDMPEIERQCKHERNEECETRMIEEECKCVPWELQSVQVAF